MSEQDTRKDKLISMTPFQLLREHHWYVELMSHYEAVQLSLEGAKYQHPTTDIKGRRLVENAKSELAQSIKHLAVYVDAIANEMQRRMEAQTPANDNG